MSALVFDTNFHVSYFLSDSNDSLQFKIIKFSLERNSTIYISEYIISEIKKTLLKNEKLKTKYDYTDEDVADFIESAKSTYILIDNLPFLQVVRDVKDDPILATAVKSQADFLITRDKDLLVLNPYEQIQIITPEAFIKILYKD